MAKKKLKYNSVEELVDAVDKFCADSYTDSIPLMNEMAKCERRLNELKKQIQKHHSKERSKLHSLLNSKGFVISKGYGSLYSGYYRNDATRWRHYDNTSRSYETIHDYIEKNYLFVGEDKEVKQVALLAQNIDERIGKYFIFMAHIENYDMYKFGYGKIHSITDNVVSLGGYDAYSLTDKRLKYKIFNTEYAMRKYLKTLKEKYPSTRYNWHGIDCKAVYSLGDFPDFESEKKNGKKEV